MSKQISIASAFQIAIFIVLAATPALGDGLTASQLQPLLAASPSTSSTAALGQANGAAKLNGQGQVTSPIASDVGNATLNVAGTSRTLAIRGSDRANMLDYSGVSANGTTDITNPLQAAEETARSGPSGGASLYLPTGSYCVSGAVYANGHTTWALDSGVSLTCGGILIGFTDAISGQIGQGFGAVGSPQGITSTVFASMLNGASPSTTAPYQHNALYARILQTDDSTDGFLHDSVAVFGTAALGGGLSYGRTWGSNFTVQVPAGTNGYAVGSEIEMHTDSPSQEMGMHDAHIAINAECSGSYPCTAGLNLINAGQPFMHAIFGYQNNNSVDFIHYVSADGLDTPLFTVGNDGSLVTAGSLSFGASGNGYNVGSGIMTTTGIATGRINATALSIGTLSMASDGTTTSSSNATFNGVAGRWLRASATPLPQAAASAQLAWNCSGGQGEACVTDSGDTGTSHGFAVYQYNTTNGTSQRVWSVDGAGNVTNVAAVQFAQVTAASLPTSCLPGQAYFVSNARNTGEAAGAGSGAIAYCTGAGKWYVNGAAVSY